MNRTLTALVVGSMGLALLAPATPVSGQTLRQRMEHLRQKQQEADVAARQEVAASKTGQFLVANVRTGTGVMEAPAKQVIDFISVASGVTIIVNWNALAELGIDPEQPVTLVGPDLTGERALDLLVAQLDVDGQLMWEPTAHYVRIITKDQANKEQVVRVYPIGDLLMTVPNFTNAPDFDLTEVTRSPASSGGGGGGQQNLFQQNDNDEPALSMAERGEQIATIIKETIEPDIWRDAGGLGGSVRYWQQHLIVSAPMYVHKQIMGDVHVPGTPTVRPVELAPAADRPRMILADGKRPEAGQAAAAGGGAGALPGARAPSGPAEAAVRQVRAEQVFVSTPVRAQQAGE